MASFTYIDEPEPPWIFKSSLSVAALDSTIRSVFHRCNLMVMQLNGRSMARVAGVFEEFGKVLEFPDYYGENSAALFDCLQDLSWVPASGYVLVLANAEAVLVDESVMELCWLVELSGESRFVIRFGRTETRNGGHRSNSRNDKRLISGDSDRSQSTSIRINRNLL